MSFLVLHNNLSSPFPRLSPLSAHSQVPLLLHFHSWEIPLLDADPGPPRSFILFSLDIFIVLLQPTCRSLHLQLPGNPTSLWGPNSTSFLPHPLLLVSYLISIPICHSLICRHTSQQVTFNYYTFLRSREICGNQRIAHPTNKEKTQNHLNHRNSRCLRHQHNINKWENTRNSVHLLEITTST